MNLRFSAVIIFSFVIFSAAALAHEGDLKDEMDSISTHASDYEAGKISFLQLKVLTESIGEKIRNSVSEGFVKIKSDEKERCDFEGLSTEAIERLLGPST